MNPTGWNVDYHTFSLDKLDEMEQYFIKVYANSGYQLRNKTGGGQGDGKFGIAENKSSKGYRDGIKYGREKLKKELKALLDKYLIIEKKNDGKLAQNALQKFKNLLEEE